MLRLSLIVVAAMAALGGPVLAQPAGPPLNREELLFCAAIHYTLMKLPERKDDAAGVDLDGKRVGFLLSKAEEQAKAQGVSSEGDKGSVANTWLSLRDRVDKSPTPAARTGFIAELNSAADECMGRMR